MTFGDPLSEFIDLLAAPSVASNAAADVSKREPATAEAGQHRLVQKAFRDASQRIKLPKQIHLSYVSGAGGWSEFTRDGQYRITLGVEVPPERLYATAVHELWHTHDYCTGVARTLSRLEMERRALRFEHEMTGGIGMLW